MYLLRRRGRQFLVSILALAGVACLIAGIGLAQGPEPPEPRYDFSGQIVTRLNENGVLEFCLRTDDGQTICPRARYLNIERAPRDAWVASSEVSWTAPIDVGAIQYVADNASPTDTPDEGSGSCAPDFERMLAATWKVETSGTFGTAFHVGNGRFVTAYHVIERRPPFVSLIHGQRTIGAAVIGVDPDFDLALLEVDSPGLVQDVPALRMRAPTTDDVGEPIYLIGYPGGEALTISGGGVVSQVWDDNIQTSAVVRGGNSGGPVFDACGAVIGVLWAGGSSWSYTYSGGALMRSLQRLNDSWPRWPLTPASVPPALRAAERLIWHYGPEPPQDVDCSELDADWWIALSAIGDEAEVRADLERAGWRQIGVCGASGPDDFDNGFTYVAALKAIAAETPSIEECAVGAAPRVLHQSVRALGSLRLTLRDPAPECPEVNEYSLRVDFATPQTPGVDLGATLIGADGSQQVGAWSRKSYSGTTLAADSPVATFWQDWSVHAGFMPIAIRLAAGGERWFVPLELDQERIAPSEFGSAEVSVAIAARIDSESGAVRVCLLDEGVIHCGPDGGWLGPAVDSGRWRETAPISWSASLPSELTAIAAHAPRSALTCQYQDPHQLYAWQFNSLAGTATAVHVGNRQFLVNLARVPDGAPWGVVSRGELSLPVVRVASDPRKDLALVELFDAEQQIELGTPARFGLTSDALIDSYVHMLTYPAGNAGRYLISVLSVTDMSERVLRVEPTGNGRHGSPLIDLCDGSLLGVSLGGDDLLRAETVRASWTEMRERAERPRSQNDGPPAHGTASAYSRPLYDGPIQPQFSGRICNVHPSERYHGRYAVYVSSVDNPDVWRVYERDGARPDTCDFGDKIFIVEYRDDRTPEAICIEPRRPTSPESTAEWELDAPEGVELLQVTGFVRDDCPGLSTLEQTRWFSTHYFKLRNTGEHEFENFTVRVLTDEGKRLVPRRDIYSFADSDVWAWRVRVTEGAPVKVVVTVR
ncbi:MAG: trypsin-like peptidase domain-containing protein [Chloroflexi bacterium]|nr:trypsin-like peptidase domain-containing protein [Chloroflexota bacterium]MCY3697923.1 trypsin-like peptidase domain-containing protein [Chloroflexota bacterium]